MGEQTLGVLCACDVRAGAPADINPADKAIMRRAKLGENAGGVLATYLALQRRSELLAHRVKLSRRHAVALPPGPS